jgi:NAD(P)-dependent dehydrogenase (short-subunit alcohol dehydrogenase family)
VKTIVITGANSGIGLATARQLALNGNLVIAASRKRVDSLAKFEEINELCHQQKSTGKVKFFPIDLANLDSVRSFAKLIKSQFPTIDTLICNAGVMNTPYQLTKDGFELQFQTNFLSHFILIQLFVEALHLSENPKVIIVCSTSAEKGKIDNLAALKKIASIPESDYDAMTSYRESKLAQEISMFEFARREKYQRLKFSLVHPGVVNTPLFYRNHGDWYKVVMTPLVYLGYAFKFFKTPEQGADTSIFLAETEVYESGRYWHNRKNIQPNPISQDREYAKALWEWIISLGN